jgi:heme/copper-type cytochrome/quinol oxidase subunit 1
MKIKQRPYNLLLLTGLVLLLASFFVLNKNNATAIDLHDTYFVIAHIHSFQLLALVVLIIWTLYLLSNKILYSKVLTWIHTIITAVMLILFAIAVCFSDFLIDSTTQRHSDYTNRSSYNTYETYNTVIAIILSMLFFGQTIFIINLIAGLFKWKKK